MTASAIGLNIVNDSLVSQVNEQIGRRNRDPIEVQESIQHDTLKVTNDAVKPAYNNKIDF